jgi:hypothetical protein
MVEAYLPPWEKVTPTSSCSPVCTLNVNSGSIAMRRGAHFDVTSSCRAPANRSQQLDIDDPRVLAAAMEDDLPFESTRQIEVACEHIPDVRVSIASLVVAPPPARLLRRSFAAGIGPSRVTAGTSPNGSGIIVAVAGTNLELTQIVIASGIISRTTLASVIEAFLIAGVVVARVEIHGAALRETPLQCPYAHRR